jgi:hypothetical protein
VLGTDAWTSLAYVAAGVVVFALAVSHHLRPVFAVLGLLTAVEGAGSLLYHAGDGGQSLHDVALGAVLGFVAGWHLGRLTGHADLGALAGAATSVVVPASTSVTMAVAVGVVAVADVVVHRRGLAAVWTRPLLVLGAVALAAWLAGGHLHGLWHVLTALLVIGWAEGASSASVSDQYGAGDESTGGVGPRPPRRGIVLRRR